MTPPVRAAAYRCGEAWSTLIGHRPSGRRLLIQGSAGFVKGALSGQRADAVYLSVGQLGLQPRSYLVDYWTETVRAVGARRVIVIHWDDFFRPLSKPLRALPYAGDDLNVSIRILDELAAQDGSHCISRRCGGARILGSEAVSELELTVALLLLAVVLGFAVVRPRGWSEAVAAVPAALVLIAIGAISFHQAAKQVADLSGVVGFLGAVLVLAKCATTRVCSRRPAR